MATKPVTPVKGKEWMAWINMSPANATTKIVTPTSNSAVWAGAVAPIPVSPKIPEIPMISTPTGVTPWYIKSSTPVTTAPKVETVPAAPVKPKTTPVKPVVPTNAPAPADNWGDVWLGSNAPSTTSQRIKEARDKKTLQEQQDMVKSNPSLAWAMTKLWLKYAADNAPTQPWETPTPPAWTETATPSTTTQPDYQDDSAARIQEITDHLNAAYTNTPNLFADRTTFEKNFNYGLRSDAQKAALDTFYHNKTNEKKYGNMSATQIGALYSAGNFDIDDVDFMKTTDPTKYAAIQAAITTANNNIVNQGTLDTLNGTTSPVVTNANSATAAADATLKSYQDTLNATDITEKQDKINTLTGEISQIDLDIDKIKKEVTDEYKDKGISKSLMNSIITDRTNDYNNQKNAKLVETNTLTNQLNSRLTKAKADYDAQIERNKAVQQDFTNNLALFQTQWNMQKDQATLELQQAAAEQWKFTTTTDPLWRWYIVTNTKTGESTLKTFEQMAASWWTGSTTTSSTSLNIPRNVNWYTNNVGVDTNNFWNITSAVAWNIGMYNSPNGRSYAVFANAQDWYNALVNDIKAKQSGNSTKANANTTVADFLWVWVNGKPWTVDSKYLNRALAASWLSANAKIWSVSSDALAKAVMAWEGTLDMYNKWGIDLSSYGASNQLPTSSTTDFSEAQKKYFDKFTASTQDAKAVQSFLTNNWLSKSQYDAYINRDTWTTDDALAKMIATYQLDSSKLNVLRSDPEKWANIMQKVDQYNPNQDWSDAAYAANKQAIMKFSAGWTVANSVNSLNTVMGHLWNYMNQINEENFWILGKPWNRVSNTVGSIYGNAKTTLWATAQAIWEELAKFYGWGTSSEAQREWYTSKISTSATPTQAKAYVLNQLDLLWSKMKEYNQQYKQATWKFFPNILGADAVKAINTMNTIYNTKIKISDITWNPADDVAQQQATQSAWSSQWYTF